MDIQINFYQIKKNFDEKNFDKKIIENLRRFIRIKENSINLLDL